MRSSRRRCLSRTHLVQDSRRTRNRQTAARYFASVDEALIALCEWESFMDLTGFRSEARRLGKCIGSECRDLWQSLAHGSSADHALKSNENQASVLGYDEVAELELLSESLQIDKEKIVDGELSIRKEVITELQTIQVPVAREELVVERLSADGRHTTEVFAGRRQLRIPISKERVVVKKENVVSEVAKISRRQIRETKRVSGNVRHEELRISGEGPAPGAGEKDKAA
jgi:uncharacterized protein (TIGR02271 family)